MLQAHSALRALLKKSLVSSVLAALPVLVAGYAWADDSGKKVEPAVRLLSSVPIPVNAPSNTLGGTFSFDISFVDQSDGTYYLADRNNFAVDALFAESIVKQIVPNNGHAPFAGISPPAFSTATAGPNGVVAAFPWLFVTDAPSRVLSFDLRQNPALTVSEVTTMAGDPTRTDELAYDPKDGLILAINNASSPAPFGTLIKVDQATGVLSVVTNIIFDAAHGVDAQNGAEQPVWDPGTQKFYLSIPQIGANPTHGGVIRISTTGTVGNNLPDRVLLAGRPRLGAKRGSARRLQYDLGGYGRRVMDRECGQTHPYRSTPISDPECDNGQHRSERAGCGRR